MLDVAEAFAAVGTSAQARVPAALVARFGLAEAEPDDFEGFLQPGATYGR